MLISILFLLFVVYYKIVFFILLCRWNSYFLGFEIFVIFMFNKFSKRYLNYSIFVLEVKLGNIVFFEMINFVEDKLLWEIVLIDLS